MKDGRRINLKRAISLLIVITMLAANLVVSFAQSEATVKYEREYELIKGFGIVDDKFSPESELSRGEFASLIAKLLYSYISYADTSGIKGFSDVSSSYEYNDEIKALKELKIINGDGFGNFYPEKPITMSAAITMAVNALGYSAYAGIKGEWPTGYYIVAKETNLLSDLDITETVSGYQAAKLLYNILKSDILKITFEIPGSENFTVEPANEKGMEYFFKIKEYDGIITDVGYFGITGNAGEGKTVLSDYLTNETYIFNYNNNELVEYIGYRVNLYSKYDEESGKNNVVYFEVNEKMIEKSLNGDEIISYNSNYIETEENEETGKINKYNLSSSVNIIRNGIRTAKLSAISFDNGFVKLIDYNNDKSYDAVLITDFEKVILTDSFSKESGIIRCRINPKNSLKFDEEELKRVRVVKNGITSDFSSLAINDIVSVAKSEEKTDGYYLYALYASDKVCEGSVTSTDYSNGYIHIDGVEYKISSSYIKGSEDSLYDVAIGSEVAARMDVCGKIIYFDNTSQSTTNYAYLINLYQKNSVENEPLLRVYTLYNEFSDYEISDHCKIDGKILNGKSESADAGNGNQSLSKFDEIRELLCIRPDRSIDIPAPEVQRIQNKSITSINPRPAIIKVNGKGSIVSIETDAPNYDNEKDENNAPETLKPGQRFFKSGFDPAYLNSLNTANGEFFVTDKTTVLLVPDIDRYGMTSTYSNTNISTFELDLGDINNYKVGGLADLKGQLDVQIYDQDPFTGVVDLVVVRGAKLTESVLIGPVYVYEKMTDFYDSEKEKMVKKLYFLNGSSEFEALYDKDEIHEYYNNIVFGGKYPISFANTGTSSERATDYIDVEPLKQGDVVALTLSGRYIDHIQRDVNLSLINDKRVSSYRASLPGNPYLATAFQSGNTGIPYDQRNYPVRNSYRETMNLELFIPMTLRGETIKMLIPYSPGTTTMGFLKEFISAQNINECQIKFVKLNPSTLKVMIVEETECDVHNDNCKYHIRPGSLDDVIYAETISDGNYNKASRIYSYSIHGAYDTFVVFNLTEKHATYVK